MAASYKVSSVPQHQVLINFRGRDLRHTFISHLEKALRYKNINVFIDANAAKGQRIDILLKEIDRSSIALAIFSQGYTESDWCLNELLRISERMDEKKLVTIPIFYMVDPTTVKHQSGAFGDVLRMKKRDIDDAKVKKRDIDDAKVKKWEEALQSVGNVLGFTFDGKRYNCLPASF